MKLQMDLSYVFSVVITGLVVVFLTLVLLVLFVWLLGKLFDAINNSKKKKDESKNAESAKKTGLSETAVKSPSPVVQNGIDDEVVAVIAAAVSAMSDENTVYAIRSIKKSGKSSRRTAWGAAGIRQSTSQF